MKTNVQFLFFSNGNAIPNTMDEAATLFTLFYVVFGFCFIFKTNEFVSMGITPESIFYKFVGNEADNFVFYQIKRTSLTLFLHSLFLLGKY